MTTKEKSENKGGALSQFAAAIRAAEAFGGRPSAVTDDLCRISFQTAPTAMCLVATDSRVLAVNSAFERLTQFAAAADGTLLSELFVTCDGQPLSYECLQQGVDELRLRHSAGRSGELRATATRSPYGDDPSLLLAIEEVSDEERSETPPLWRQLPEMLPGAIKILRRGAGREIVDRHWCEWTGVHARRSAGEDWLDAVHPDDRARVASTLATPLEDRPTEFEYRIVRPDGSVRWLMEVVRAEPNHRDGRETLVGYCLDVTDRKLQDREIARLTRVLEQSPVMVMITDAAGTIEYVNDRFIEVTGYSRAEIVGQNPRLLKSGHTSEAEYADFWKSLVAHGEWRGEFRNRKKNGELYWESISVSAIRDARGAVINYVALKSDVTDKKALDERLRLSEERFRIAAHTASDLVIEVDPQTESGRLFVSQTDRHSKWRNFPESVEKLRDLIHPDDAARVLETYTLSVSEGIAVQIECRVVFRGETFDIVLRGKPVMDSAANCSKWIAVLRDVTESKRLESALRESEERFRMVFEHSAIGICIAECGALRTVRANSAMCDIVGCTEQEFAARTPRDYTHPDDWRRQSLLMAEVEAGRLPAVRMEKRYIRKDGSIVWVNLTASLVRDLAGHPLYWIAIVENINDRKRAAEETRLSEQRFRLAAAAVSDIVFETDLETGAVHLVDDRSAKSPDQRKLPGTLDEWYRIIHPDDRSRVRQIIEEHKVVRQPYQVDFRIVEPDGSTRDLAAYVSPLDVNGVRKSIGAMSDITERKRAENTMAHLAAIVHASDDAIIALDLDGIVTAWNHGSEQMHGYTAAEAIGRHYSFVVPRRDRKSAASLHEQVKGGVSVRNVEAARQRKDGRIIPVLLTLSPIRDSRGNVTAISAIAHDVSRQKQAEALLAHHAHHDMLTGLANRRLFEARLQEAIDRAARRNCLAALIYVDLDGFKLINDTLGHSAGDEVLKVVARRLSEAARKSDTLARTGGDEFCIVLDAIETPHDAKLVASKLLDTLRRPVAVGTRDLFVSASLGISIYPWHGANAGALQQTADAAMYEAKRAGKNQFYLFAPEMADMALERLDLENDLRRALDRNELSLHFQAQFRVRDLAVSGAESLLRWNHPTRGQVLPSVFIPVAEETGLIVPIGTWALQQACEAARQSRGTAGRISVNASAVQFGMPDFVDTVLDTLSRASVDPRAIEVEVTESAVMRNCSDAAAKMERLRRAGVSIALDDFGTGYSSLSCLQRMPIDALKLDKSFLEDVAFSHTAVALMKGVIALAHSLKLRVVAEGVESEPQLRALRDTGCDEAQGFLLGGVRPSWHSACFPKNLKGQVC